jgi:hypothetical protein
VLSSTFNSNGPLRSVLQIVLVTAIIITGYSLLLTAIGPGITQIRDAGLRNRVVAEQYFDGDVSPAVIVGSSVAAGIAPDALLNNYLGPSIFNLALLGEGASTGIEIILKKPASPSIVLVDPRFGNRPPNAVLLQEMVAEPRATLRRYIPALRLENRPINLLIDTVSVRMRRSAIEVSNNSIPSLDQIEPEGDLALPLQYWVAQNASLPEWRREEIKSGISAMGELVDRLRARNVRVVFVWFPMHPALAASPVEAFSQHEVEARFPFDRYEWFSIPKPESYRTMDGMHTTRPSGRRLAIVLRNFVEQMSVSLNPAK